MSIHDRRSETRPADATGSPESAHQPGGHVAFSSSKVAASLGERTSPTVLRRSFLRDHVGFYRAPAGILNARRRPYPVPDRRGRSRDQPRHGPPVAQRASVVLARQIRADSSRHSAAPHFQEPLPVRDAISGLVPHSRLCRRLHGSSQLPTLATAWTGSCARRRTDDVNPMEVSAIANRIKGVRHL